MTPADGSETSPLSPPDPSRRLAALFDRVADTYESVGVPWFEPIAQGLVGAVAPQAGERAVDLGCGRGAALFPIAAAVGKDGRVSGIDLSPRMVALAGERAAELGLTTVDLQVGDVARLELPPGQADLVTASLVLFFVPQPQQVLTGWADLLRPGGRLGISTFDRRDQAWRDLDDLFTPYLPPQLLDARTSGESGPFGSDEGVAGLFTGAGLTDVRTTHADITVGFDDVDAWVTWSSSHGQRAMWDQVPDGDRTALVATATTLLDGVRDQGGRSRLTQRVRYTVGVRA